MKGASRGFPAAFALALLLLLVMIAPAAAHMDHPIPRSVLQENRDPSISMNGAFATVDLRPAGDPLRDLVQHTVNPTLGTYSIEHRPTGSGRENAFRVIVELPRFIEYRDVNDDLRYDPAIDALVRAWRMDDGRWTIGTPQDAAIGTLRVKTATWTGSLSSGPKITVQIAAAGRVLRDEGAFATPNDIVIYLQVDDPPPRATGHLYAFDGRILVGKGVDAREYRTTQNVTTAVLARQDRHMEYFQWGGEAIIDKRERVVDGWLGDGRAVEGGLEHPFRISFPILDKSARLVIVHGLQYVHESKRTDAPGVALLLAGIAALALVSRKR